MKGPTKAYRRHEHLNQYGKSDLKISLWACELCGGKTQKKNLWKSKYGPKSPKRAGRNLGVELDFCWPVFFAGFCTMLFEKCSFVCFEVGISRTNADSQWNPVYNAFHRFFCGANETMCWQFFKRELDAANLRPVLEEQKPSARILFFQANLLYVPNVKMQRRLRSRSVQSRFLDICKKRSAAQCQIPIFSSGETRFFSEVAIAQWFSFRNYPKTAQTQISVSSSF